MREFEKLLLENKAWSEEKRRSDPKYFRRLAEENRPSFLWIGCSDARVPATAITGTQPGEMFVHRNIANMVVHTDISIMSVVQFATDELGIEHIIVCGHYGCNGINAALTSTNHGLMNKWLRNIKDVYRLHLDELKPLENDREKLADRLVEFNVIEQVENLAKTSIVQRSWQRNETPTLHGWVYSLEDGLLRELCKHAWDDPMDPVYRFDDHAFDE
jgi:carbonic anhydrase